jgi:hypothetical protein
MKKKTSKKKNKAKTDPVLSRLDRLEESMSELIDLVEQIRFRLPYVPLNGEKNYPYPEQPIVWW